MFNILPFPPHVSIIRWDILMLKYFPGFLHLSAKSHYRKYCEKKSIILKNRFTGHIHQHSFLACCQENIFTIRRDITKRKRLYRPRMQTLYRPLQIMERQQKIISNLQFSDMFRIFSLSTSRSQYRSGQGSDLRGTKGFSQFSTIQPKIDYSEKQVISDGFQKVSFCHATLVYDLLVPVLI